MASCSLYICRIVALSFLIIYKEKKLWSIGVFLFMFCFFIYVIFKIYTFLFLTCCSFSFFFKKKKSRNFKINCVFAVTSSCKCKEINVK